MTHPSLSLDCDCHAITAAECGSFRERPEIVVGMNVLTKHAHGSCIISLVSRCWKPFERCGSCQGLRTYLYQNQSTPIPKESAILKICLWCPWACGSCCLIGPRLWHVLLSTVLNDACVMGFLCRYCHGWFKTDPYWLTDGSASTCLQSLLADSRGFIRRYFDIDAYSPAVVLF